MTIIRMTTPSLVMLDTASHAQCPSGPLWLITCEWASQAVGIAVLPRHVAAKSHMDWPRERAMRCAVLSAAET